MKKAMLLAVCLILAGLLAVNGTFALPNISELFSNLTDLLSDALGLPTEDEQAFNVSLVYPGETQTPLLSPGTEVEREIAAANASPSSPAYFRIAIAVQTNALPALVVETSGSDYAWTEPRDITIGNRPYQLMIATYKQELPAGQTSPPIGLHVALNASVTSEQMAQIDADFLQIQVLAVDASAFANAEITPGEGQTLAEAVLDKALPIDEPFNPFE